MNYKFPIIKNIEDVLPAIEGADEFIIKKSEESGIAIINYLFATPETFPDPTSFDDPVAAQNAAIRRECRGLKFDLETGEIVTRPYAKFFNINEKESTQIGNIDWSQRHWILEKLDGSLVTFGRSPDGTLEAHTKMGRTEVALPVEEFIKKSSVQYENFYSLMAGKNYTAIFEWLSYQQKIVLSYEQENLILTALRHNETGEYIEYPKMAEIATGFGIPVVKAHDSEDNIVKFISRLYDEQDIEGYVFRFADGHMVKCKTKWYVEIHKTKNDLATEKNVWTMILNETLDDVLPFMSPEDRVIVEKFVVDFEHEIEKTAYRLFEFVKQAREEIGDDKKRFALEYVKNVPAQERGLLFSIWDRYLAIEVVWNFLKKNTGSKNKIEDVRHLVGNIQWQKYYRPIILDD